VVQCTDSLRTYLSILENLKKREALKVRLSTQIYKICRTVYLRNVVHVIDELLVLVLEELVDAVEARALCIPKDRK
jgi:hypothetical protein